MNIIQTLFDKEKLIVLLFAISLCITLTTFFPETNLLANPYGLRVVAIVPASVMVAMLIWSLYIKVLLWTIRMEGGDKEMPIFAFVGFCIIAWCSAVAIHSYNAIGSKDFISSVSSENGVRLITLFLFGIITLRISSTERASFDKYEASRRAGSKR